MAIVVRQVISYETLFLLERAMDDADSVSNSLLMIAYAAIFLHLPNLTNIEHTGMSMTPS